jgi:hypothetical protein
MSITDSPWAGILKLSPHAGKSLISDIPAGDGKISLNFFHGVSALAAGAYTTTLFVMVEKTKGGGGRAPPTLSWLI